MSLRPAADPVVPPEGAAPTTGNRLRQVLATGAAREARDTEHWMIVLSFKRVEVGHLTDEGTPKMLEISIRDNLYTGPGNTPAVQLEEAVGEAIKGWMRADFQMGDYGSFSHIGARRRDDVKSKHLIAVFLKLRVSSKVEPSPSVCVSMQTCTCKFMYIRCARTLPVFYRVARSATNRARPPLLIESSMP